MSPIPGEPLDPKQPDLVDKNGRKVTLKIKGLAPKLEPLGTEQRQPPEPPRDDPRGSFNPNAWGS